MFGTRPSDRVMPAESSDPPVRPAASARPVRRWSLGDCIVDVERHCVLRQEREFRLAPKAVAVLVCLIEAGQRVVSRNDLMDAVWPDADVGEEVLTQAIAELRRALGEQARDGAVVETIRKSGYRLRLPAVALADAPSPIDDTTSAASPEASARPADTADPAVASRGPVDTAVPSRPAVPPSTPPVRPPSRPRPALSTIVVAALVLLLVVAGALVFGPWARHDDRTWSRPAPVTSDLGSESAPALSPDGAAVAYLRSTLSGRQLTTVIEVRSLGAATATVVARHDLSGDPRQPAWSPDGRTLAFERLDGNACRIVAVSAIGGGDERTLGDCVAVSDAFSEITWRGDGGAIVYARPVDPNDRDGDTALYLLDLATRESHPLPIDAPPGNRFHPRLAPDGRTLAFLLGSEQRARVFRVGLDGGTAAELTASEALVRGMAWLPDSRSLVLSSGRELWQVGRDGGEPRPLAIGNAVQPAIALREPVLVYAEVQSTAYNLQDFRVPSADAVPRYADAGPVLFGSTRHSRQASYSPDGAQIAFVSDRSGDDQVWSGPADGGEPRRLSAFTGGRVVDDLTWTADGEAVWVSSHDPDRQGRIERWQLRDGRVAALAQAESPFGAIARAADGSGLWVSRGDAPARVERIDSDGAAAIAPVDLGPGAINGLADGGDGFLYFSRSGDPSLYRREYAGPAAVQRLAGSQRIDADTGWVLTADGIVLWGRLPGGEALLAIPRSGGAPELFSGLTGMFANRNFALSPDRAHLLFVSSGNREIDLRVMRLEATPAGR